MGRWLHPYHGWTTLGTPPTVIRVREEIKRGCDEQENSNFSENITVRTTKYNGEEEFLFPLLSFALSWVFLHGHVDF